MGISSHGGGGEASVHGQPHTGGGGAGAKNNGAGGNGGSGSILLRYPLFTCIACAAGKINAGGGNSTTCTDCPAGTFAELPGSSECLPCPHGTYARYGGSQSCTKCKAGDASRDVTSDSAVCNEQCEDVSTQNAAFHGLLVKKPPISISIFTYYNDATKKVLDPRGTGAYVVFGDTQSDEAPSLPTKPSEGRVDNTVTFLRGNENTRMRWSSELPPTVTLCFATRWGEGTRKGRILGCTTDGGMDSHFGHYGQYVGRISYSNVVREEGSILPDGQDSQWTVMCTTNGFNGKGNLVYGLKAPLGDDTKNIGVWPAPGCTLDVNYVADADVGSSDFYMHSVYVWDVVLSVAEMNTVTKGILKEIGEDTPDTCPIVDLAAYYSRVYPLSTYPGAPPAPPAVLLDYNAQPGLETPVETVVVPAATRPLAFLKAFI
jgi:hypothetical protein